MYVYLKVVDVLKKKEKIKAYVDGSSSGMYGYEIIDPEPKRRIMNDYPLTNNQAEWLALLLLLMDLEPHTEIEVYSDSQIVVNQLVGNWETRNDLLKNLKAVCLLVIETKKLKVSLSWIPRKENLFGKYLEKLLRNERKKRNKLQEKIKRGW